MSVAEDVHIPERLVTAPRAGTFVPHISPEQQRLVVGQALGVIVTTGEEHVVRSPFAGTLMGLLALPGERVRPGQPVFWLTTA
jgi:biotin carboxyl carrier protein